MALKRFDKPRRATRDFHRPRQGNPMFSRVQGGRRNDGSGWGGTLAFVVALPVLFGVWYAVWSPAFRAADIEVSGIDAASEAAVRAGLATHLDGYWLGIVPRDNLLFFSSRAASEAIGQNVYLASATIRKKLPHSVVVEASEKTARAALDWESRLYSVDEEGAIIRELKDDEIARLDQLPPRLQSVAVVGLGAEEVHMGSPTDTAVKAAPVVKEEKPPGIPLIIGEAPEVGTVPASTPGTVVVPQAAMRVVLQAHARLPDIAGVNVLRFVVRPASETVEAVMEGEWKILLSSALPFDVQGDRLAIVLREKIGKERVALEYIDLRYNERIFYRMKGQGSDAPSSGTGGGTGN